MPIGRYQRLDNDPPGVQYAKDQVDRQPAMTTVQPSVALAELSVFMGALIFRFA